MRTLRGEGLPKTTWLVLEEARALSPSTTAMEAGDRQGSLWREGGGTATAHPAGSWVPAHRPTLSHTGKIGLFPVTYLLASSDIHLLMSTKKK